MDGTLHLIAPSAPPKICGVADHSLFLGRALATRTPLRLHCGQSDPVPDFAGLNHRTDFDHSRTFDLYGLAGSSEFRPSDAIVLQYTNFAYAKWGLNTWLAPALSRWRRRGLKVATMFHETFTDQPGIKGMAMRSWQRFFFRRAGRASDLCLFSIDPWTRRYRSWFPHARVETLAVGSNIPRIPIDREAHRASLGIGSTTLVLGVFGGTHPSRLFPWIADASRMLASRGIDHLILRIGPDSEEVRQRLADAPLLDRGILPSDEVSRSLSCCDIFLGPVSDGASSRRGSLLAGIAHGLPCISTSGPSTDESFRQAGGSAIEFAEGMEHFSRICFELALDPARRMALGREALEFHRRNFDWDAIALRLLGMLEEEHHLPAEGKNAIDGLLT